MRRLDWVVGGGEDCLGRGAVVTWNTENHQRDSFARVKDESSQSRSLLLRHQRMVTTAS